MTGRRVIAVTALVGAALMVIIATHSGGHGYRVDLRLSNAGGLREGSDVTIGGVPVGSVESLQITSRDQVRATLELRSGKGPIGAGSSAQLKAKNLLGEKQVELSTGDLKRPQPSGTIIPQRRVTEPVDLDQVLDTLDAPTRAKLGVLINEAGASMVGRGVDVNRLLRELPPGLSAGRRLVDDVAADNHTLGELIDRSDRFVGTFARQRGVIGDLVHTAAGAADTVAARDRELAATLAQAPGTLRELTAFLTDLQSTTPPLGQAAKLIARTAPPATKALDALPAFVDAAKPTLTRARAVAPQLTTLGRRATPILRAARPTVGALDQLVQTAAPVSRTLDESIDLLTAILQGWSRAILSKDGISHFFRAKVNFNADTLRGILSRFDTAPARRKTSGTPTRNVDRTPAAPAASSAPAPPNRRLEDSLGKSLDAVTGVIGSLVKPLAPGPDPQSTPGQGGSSASNLLNHLLGH